MALFFSHHVTILTTSHCCDAAVVTLFRGKITPILEHGMQHAWNHVAEVKASFLKKALHVSSYTGT
jgi:hypothetical protein